MKPRTLAVIPKTAWPRIRRRLLIPIGTLAVIVALYLGVSYVILAKSLEPIRTVSDRTPVGEEISFESDVDRLPLTGSVPCHKALPPPRDRSRGTAALLPGLRRHHSRARRPGDRAATHPLHSWQRG